MTPAFRFASAACDTDELFSVTVNRLASFNVEDRICLLDGKGFLVEVCVTAEGILYYDDTTAFNLKNDSYALGNLAYGMRTGGNVGNHVLSNLIETLASNFPSDMDIKLLLEQESERKQEAVPTYYVQKA